MKLFLTSDHHFWHTRILEYCSRSFANVRDMNEKFIENWNNVVSHGDVVIHLGDVSLLPECNDLASVVTRLNGKKLLVPGNHDRPNACKFYESLGWYVTKKQRTNAKSTHKIAIGDVLLCHEPAYACTMPEINVVLHGHCHGVRKDTPEDPRTYVDVGVDCWSYAPVELSNLLDADRCERVQKHVVELVSCNIPLS